MATGVKIVLNNVDGEELKAIEQLKTLKSFLPDRVTAVKYLTAIGIETLKKEGVLKNV